MIYKRRTIASDQKAFTIVELMIATSILSVILVLVTAMMIGIGNLYYNTVDAITQDLQLNGSALLQSRALGPTLPNSYCIGTVRYTYVLGREISSTPGVDQSYHVLWRDTIPIGATCPSILASTFDSTRLSTVDPGTELAGPNTMLTAFSITTGNSPFTVTVSEASGSSDLLCDSGPPAGDCSLTTTSTRIWDSSAPTGTVLCKGQAGDQFCSTASLTTVVTERL
jgi:prepilin-type N-terminal cleavage/methylation domain-containing protein